MLVVYRLSDRIPVKIGEATFIMGPLSYSQKSEILGNIKMEAGTQTEDALAKAYLAIKYSVKGIKGVKTLKDEPFKLDFENGVLTDESTSNVMNINETTGKLMTYAFHFANGTMDPKIDGVEVKLDEAFTEKK